MYVLLLAALVSVGAALEPAPATPCTHVASRGSDLDGFVNGLQPGDVGCLRAGRYGARASRTAWQVSGTASAPITLQGYPGEARPVILGSFVFEGDHLTGSGLVFDGPPGAAGSDYAISVWVTGDDDELRNSEVREAESQGIYLDGADRVRLVGNYIHHNGDTDDPTVANLHHGIYFASGSGLIADNLIVRNYSFGVHLYPSARDVLVVQNTIVGHGRAGVIIAGEPGQPVPAFNRVVGNVIASNAQQAVTSYGPLGFGNVVEHNVVWANGTAGQTRGLAMRANFELPPRLPGVMAR